jgi:hypothetical protein
MNGINRFYYTAAEAAPMSQTTAAGTRTAGPFMDAAYMLPESERYCTCCERELSGGAFRYLELDQRSDTYHDFNDVPTDRSQGWFPFGLTCARKLVAKEAQRRAALAKTGGAA